VSKLSIFLDYFEKLDHRTMADRAPAEVEILEETGVFN
jgi:hypothetical protein